MTRTNVARLVLFVIAAGLFGYAARPTVALEEGHHGHLGIDNLPIATIPRADYTFRMVAQAHHQEGMSRARVRVSDYSTDHGGRVDQVASPVEREPGMPIPQPAGACWFGRDAHRVVLVRAVNGDPGVAV